MKKNRLYDTVELYRTGEQRPRFMKERENDPEVYGYICPGCEERYGDPQPRGWVDILRCKNCFIKLEAYDLEKRKRHCSRMKEYSRERYRAFKSSQGEKNNDW